MKSKLSAGPAIAASPISVRNPFIGSQNVKHFTSNCGPIGLGGEIAVEDRARAHRLSSQRGEHVGADQHDAAVAAVEALGVERRVLADDEPLRDLAAAVDDDLGEPRVAADVDLGQY